MKNQVGMRRCQCPESGNPAKQEYNPDCTHCRGTGLYFCKTEDWYIRQAIETFWIAAVCSTGHTIERTVQACVCTEPATCTVCKGRRCIEIKKTRVATADDIITLLKDFDEDGIFNDASHPSFVMRDVEKILHQASTPIILPAFRPILSEGVVIVCIPL